MNKGPLALPDASSFSAPHSPHWRIFFADIVTLSPHQQIASFDLCFDFSFKHDLFISYYEANLALSGFSNRPF